jgi:hypothetical protein
MLCTALQKMSRNVKQFRLLTNVTCRRWLSTIVQKPKPKTFEPAPSDGLFVVYGVMFIGGAYMALAPDRGDQSYDAEIQMGKWPTTK